MPRRCWVSGQWQPSFGPASVARALRALEPPRPPRARNTTNNLRRRQVPASRAFATSHATIVDPDPENKPRCGMRHESVEPRSSLVAAMEASHARDLASAISAISSFYADTPDPRRIDKRVVLDDICGIKPEDLQEVEATRDGRSEALRRIRKRLKLLWHYGPPKTKESTLWRCEEVILSEMEKGDILHAGPRTEERMPADIATMTTELVDRLQEDAWRVNEIEAPGAHPKLDSPDSASTMIRLLRSEGYPAYNHPELDPAETAAQRARLNEVNLQILSDWAGPYRERYVAKICYNILVCGVPPGIQNYNALILGFALVGEHVLAQAVVDHLLNQRPAKPTEGTFLSLLQHYRMKKDPTGFHTIIRVLFGNAWRGVGPEQTGADHVPDSREFQAWAATAYKNPDSGLYFHSAPLTQDLAEAMIEGFVDFGMCKEAAKIFAVCLAEGWTIHGNLMRRLLHSCIRLADVGAAKIIIRGLLDHIDHATLIILSPKGLRRRQVRQLRHLLNICQTCSLPCDEGEQSSSADDDISLTTSRQLENANLTRLATAIWIRETLYHTQAMDRWVSRIRRRLSDSEPFACLSAPNPDPFACLSDPDPDPFACLSDPSPSSSPSPSASALSARLDRAHKMLDAAALFPAHQLHKSELISRVSRIAWVAAEVDAARRRAHAAENQILTAVARATPRELRAGAHFNRRRAYATRLALALPFVTPGTPQYAAAMCFVRSKELDGRFKAMLLEVLPEELVRRLRAERKACAAGAGGGAAAAARRGGGEEGEGEVHLSLSSVVAYFNQYLVSLKDSMALDAKMATRVKWGRLLKRFGLAKLSVWLALKSAGEWEGVASGKREGAGEGKGAEEGEAAGEEGEGAEWWSSEHGRAPEEAGGAFAGGRGWGW